MERVMGIEPTRPAWKAGILPLNYTRKLVLYYYTTFHFACQGVFEIFSCTQKARKTPLLQAVKFLTEELSKNENITKILIT